MIKTVFFVPVRDNDGRRFPRSSWDELEGRFLPFGGVTRQSNVVGVWESAGRTYRDLSRHYTVALASWTQLPDWLAAISWVRQQFRQEAIYVEVAGVPEMIG